MADADELELLRATVRGALRAGAGLPELGELGLLGLLVPEVRGGAGWCPVEAVTVAEEVGRTTGDRGPAHGSDLSMGAPWLEVSLAAMALAAGGEAVRHEWLDPLLAGSRTVVLGDGHLEPTGRGVSGTVTGVVGGPAAIVARAGGHNVLILRSSDGVTVNRDPTSIDLALQAETWTVSEVVPIDLHGPELWPVDLIDVRRVLSASSLLGLLSAALERLMPYLSDRVAFEAHIASFQVVQHRIVDLFLIEVRSRVTVDAASKALAEQAERAGHLAAVAHGFVAAQVPSAIDECIQLTGGIGFTWEYPLHHELRRAVALAASCGGAAESRRRFALAGDARG